MNTLNSQQSSKTPLANLHDAASQVGKLQNEFKLLKSEFDLLKLCQRNQTYKKTSLTKVRDKVIINKCYFCDLTFQTEAGLKVQMDLEHQNKSEVKET